MTSTELRKLRAVLLLAFEAREVLHCVGQRSLNISGPASVIIRRKTMVLAAII